MAEGTLYWVCAIQEEVLSRGGQGVVAAGCRPFDEHEGFGCGYRQLQPVEQEEKQS